MRRRVLPTTSFPVASSNSGILPSAQAGARYAAGSTNGLQDGGISTASPSAGLQTLNSSLSTSSTLTPRSMAAANSSLNTNRIFATMAANTNQACCTIPPVKSDYSPKGTTEKIGGLDAYVIGPKDAKKAIVVVYDVFGYWPTTKQGADLLAEATKARIVMPDFFRGKPIAQEDYPPKTEEKKQKFQNFFKSTGDFSARKPEVEAVADALKKDGAQKLGLMGFCWGGKMSVLAGGEGTKFNAVAQVHPAMVDAEDAKKLTVPIANFPSKDEPKEDMEKFEAEVQKKDIAKDSVYKLYPDSHHGWAAARADLKDEGNLKNFQDVYQRLADFFNKTLA
ncbi:related to AIM2 - cytoplasmic protein involved in mitochondrial function or organization [Ustilago sp. UG-2017b]|nr:related to AIM2 - cytoplasmic protein involved in mitochondrial function or organization [Ustilago sp. UG-2017b]